MSLLDPAPGDPGFRWDAARARHLLNRAGFGGPPSAIPRLAAMKPGDAVAVFVDYERFADQLPAPDWLPEEVDFRQLRQMASGLTEQEREALRRQKTRESRDAMDRLQVWWLDRMCHSQRPLEEKMTLFWHGHFATSAEKVREPRLNFDLNQVLRRNATGNFRTLVTEVAKSPAMLRYLDNQQSTKTKPNENWARELMELFTLGIGHYTEQDIKEGARAFTGWTMRGGKFTFAAQQHDFGPKRFLGASGNFNGDDIIRIILSQPACARFICAKLWRFFAYENPEPEVVDGLADTLRESGYELKPVLRRIFLSRAFYGDRAVWTQIKSPAQLVVNLQQFLDAPISEKPPIAQLAMRAMGQSLFFPPNVKGWDGGRAWINTNTLLVRCNFANYLVSGVVPAFEGRGRFAAAQARGAAPAGAEGGMTMMEQPMADERMMTSSASERPVREAPAGQDAMGTDIPSRTFANALRQRRAAAGGARTMQRAPFRAREFFSRYEGMTATEIVDAMSGFFLGHPLDGAQRDRLVAALGQSVRPDQPVPVMRMAEEDLRAAVQLLLSTAEFQIC